MARLFSNTVMPYCPIPWHVGGNKAAVDRSTYGNANFTNMVVNAEDLLARCTDEDIYDYSADDSWIAHASVKVTHDSRPE
jgi:hypothetical protein